MQSRKANRLNQNTYGYFFRNLLICHLQELQSEQFLLLQFDATLVPEILAIQYIIINTTLNSKKNDATKKNKILGASTFVKFCNPDAVN